MRDYEMCTKDVQYLMKMKEMMFYSFITKC